MSISDHISELANGRPDYYGFLNYNRPRLERIVKYKGKFITKAEFNKLHVNRKKSSVKYRKIYLSNLPKVP